MSSATKVLFLDMDGVLVPFQHPIGRENLFWSTEAVECLNAIWVHTHAQIVISSMWRFECTKEQMMSMLNEHGYVGTLHPDWRTPGNENVLSQRGAEILEWLDAHRGVAEWIVLEDSPVVIDHFPAEITDRLIRPVSEVGLTKDSLERALNILSSG